MIKKTTDIETISEGAGAGFGINNANSWMCGIRDEKGKKSFILTTQSRYGFRGVDQSMSISLIRSTYDPFFGYDRRRKNHF